MTSVTAGGLGGLLLIVLLISSCIFCCLMCKFWRKRRTQRTDQGRSHSMVYSVTMQGANSAFFHNAVNDYLRNSQTRQDDSEHTSRQRHFHENSTKDKILTPKGLPSYEDAISGSFDSKIEPPPPYSEAAENNLGDTRQQPQ